MARAAAWTTLLLCLALAGCTRPSGDASADRVTDGALVPIRCYTQMSPDATQPVAASLVDCAAPHRAEVYAEVGMDATWPSDLDDYAVGTETSQRWEQWAIAHCGRLLQELAGADEEAEVLGLEGAFVRPVWRGNFGFALPSPQDWAAGVRRTSCHVYSEAGITLAGEWSPELLTADRPIELGACVAVDRQQYTDTPCTAPHLYEQVVSFDATSVLDPGLVAAIDPQRVTDEQFGVLNSVCARLEAPLVGTERADLAAVATVAAGWSADGEHYLYCVLKPSSGGEYFTGSALGLDEGDLDLSPAPSGPSAPADA